MVLGRITKTSGDVDPKTQLLFKYGGRRVGSEKDKLSAKTHLKLSVGMPVYGATQSLYMGMSGATWIDPYVFEEGDPGAFWALNGSVTFNEANYARLRYLGALPLLIGNPAVNAHVAKLAEREISGRAAERWKSVMPSLDSPLPFDLRKIFPSDDS
jgi:hypothetical protein